MSEQHKRRWRVSRDSVIFLVGLAIIIFEVFVEKVDRPTILILAAAMIGLPAFLHGDEQIRSKQPPSDPPSPSSEVSP